MYSSCAETTQPVDKHLCHFLSGSKVAELGCAAAEREASPAVRESETEHIQRTQRTSTAVCLSVCESIASPLPTGRVSFTRTL